jgi:hypothetical protein
VADDARCPLWNSDFFNSQLFCCYCLGIQGKGNHQRPTVYNLVGVGNINFDRLRSLAPLSILDLGGVGQRTMVAGRRLPLANQHDLTCCAAQSVSEMGHFEPPRLRAVAAELASIADADETWGRLTVRPRACWRRVLPGNRPPRLTGVAPAPGHKPTMRLPLPFRQRLSDFAGALDEKLRNGV